MPFQPWYYLIVNDHYYPSFGIDDYKGKFRDVDSAINAARSMKGLWQDFTIFTVTEDGELQEIAHGRR